MIRYIIGIKVWALINNNIISTTYILWMLILTLIQIWQTDRVTYGDTPCLKFWAWRKAAGRVQRRFSARGGPGQGDVKYLKEMIPYSHYWYIAWPFFSSKYTFKTKWVSAQFLCMENFMEIAILRQFEAGKVSIQL